MRRVSLPALRRLAVLAQGYAPRARAGAAADVERAVRALGCVQLDSISAVERSHRIVLGARVGAYPRQTVSRLLAAGRLFEYWAHEACLLPVEDWPLFRGLMTRRHPWRGDVLARDPLLAEEVRAAIRERGPLPARAFDGRSGGMWEWKPAKVVLEALWNAGELVVAGRVNGFQRLYDLPERVLPRAVLEAPPAAPEERDRELVRRAVLARGALTEAGIAEHWRLRGGARRP
ncbi:MAG TPA: crosslink repair DNA glycosylase YcaQ family protein, partial [Gaiellaceae bacterium]|nr:crosslink repair DNA glycosylase YcaQ family protein [Gaiellaceae bacterium]